MLVYHRDSMGYTSIGDTRVYGEYYCYGSFGAAEILYKDYCRNKENLIEVPITGEWLSSKFGKTFPSCKFKYTEMRKLNFDTVIEIAILLGIDYKKSRHPTDKDKTALKKAVMKKIDGLCD